MCPAGLNPILLQYPNPRGVFLAELMGNHGPRRADIVPNSVYRSLPGSCLAVNSCEQNKVVSLADIEREDRRGLNRALRVATQSRRQLPPQVLTSVIGKPHRGMNEP